MPAGQASQTEEKPLAGRSSPPVGRPLPQKSPQQYGATDDSHARAGGRPPLKPFHSSRTPKPYRPPPSGPLARVPSQGSFVPIMALDLDAVASQVSNSLGGVYTTQDLLTSLAEQVPPQGQENSQGHPQTFPPAQGKNKWADDDIWKSKHQQQVEELPVPLEVVVSEQELGEFPSDSLVLKIRQPEHDARSGSVDPGVSQGMESTLSEATNGGFAINIPVRKDRDPFDDECGASWDARLLGHFEPGYDEEDPLIQRDEGLDMTIREGAGLNEDGAAFVQRSGRRDVASEQEVTYAVPNADGLGSGHTGLLLPVMDSKNDLRELVFVVPPDQEASEGSVSELEDEQQEPAFTVEGTREYLENITNKLPSIVDVESTLEVHGTTKSATIAMNVTQEVSWVGYVVLAIALVSVASQGTAVKWLENVDGLIAASWLMQAQTCIMIPLAAYQYVTLTMEESEEFWKSSTLKQLAASSVAQVLWASGFFLAIDYTSLFHAWSLNNIHSVMIVLYCVLQKMYSHGKTKDVSSGEKLGLKFALFGVALMQIPTLLTGNARALMGDIIATCSSISAIVFLNLCKDLRSKVPLYLMMAPITAMNAVLFSAGSMAIKGTDFSVSDHGALGWLTEERIGVGLYLGGVVGFLGTMCCIAALKFLPSVVVGSVQTMMPVAGTLLAVFVGVDDLPDFWTTLGGTVLMFGVLCIADATSRSEHTVVINQHISEAGVAQEAS